MTNKDEAIANIKEALKKLMSFNTEKSVNMKYDDITLTDGSVISVESGKSVEVGTAVYKKDDTGTLTPCEDGSYTTESGKTIVVKGGLVESVSETSTDPKQTAEASPVADAKMEVQPGAEAPAEGESPETEAVEEGKSGDMEQRVAALEDQIAQILEMIQGLTKMTETTMSKVQEFAGLPAEEPIKTGKKESEDVWSKTKATRKAFSNEIDELRSIISKTDNSWGSFTVKQ